MENKKHPKFNLENYRKLFGQLGLVLALFIAYLMMEQKTNDRQFASLASVTMVDVLEEDIPITKPKEAKIPKIKPIPLEVIEVKPDDDDIVEDLIEVIDEDDPVFDVDNIVEVDVIEKDPVEDVPFIVIEDVPVFPGCKGNRSELAACFNKQMQRHFSKKFDGDLPNQLGLAPGKKRLIMLFKIDETGNIVDVRAKAPHPRLEKEVIRIVKLLPKMKPGKQRGKAVGVKYTLPMRIDVE